MTNKQKRFCEEYVIDWNATRAAIAAGYSEKTAAQIGAENLIKPDIAAYIEEIQKDLSKLAGVSALRNVLELKKIAYSNIIDINTDWGELKNIEELTDDEKAIIHKVIKTRRESDGGVTEYIKIEGYDKLRAIEDINKMLGFNAPEKSERDIKGLIRHQVEIRKTDLESDAIE